MEATTEARATIIDGLKFEHRTCSNPSCKREFRVITTSPTKTCSRDCLAAVTGNKKLAYSHLDPIGHNHEGEGKRSKPVHLPEKPVGPLRVATIEERHIADKETSLKLEEASLQLEGAVSPKIAETSTEKVSQIESVTSTSPTESFESSMGIDPKAIKWLEYVARARGYISKMAQHRLDIANLALEVCDIRWGGGDHWANHEGTYTLKRFAEDIGMNPKTLSSWVRIKRNVFDKLTEIGATIDPVQDWPAMTRTADRCKHTDTAQQVAEKFEKWDKKAVKAFNEQQYCLQARRRFQSFSYFLEENAHAYRLDKEDMAEILVHTKKIQKWILANQRKFR